MGALMMLEIMAKFSLPSTPRLAASFDRRENRLGIIRRWRTRRVYPKPWRVQSLIADDPCKLTEWGVVITFQYCAHRLRPWFTSTRANESLRLLRNGTVTRVVSLPSLRDWT